MKLVRPSTKRKQRLLIILLAVVMLVVLGIWAVQFRLMLVDSAESGSQELQNGEADIEGVGAFAESLREGTSFDNQDFNSLVEEMRKEVETEIARQQAAQQIAEGVNQKIEQEQE